MPAPFVSFGGVLIVREPIVPARLKDKQKKRKESAANRQVGLIIFTIIALGGLAAFGSYYFFCPNKKIRTRFYTYAAVDSRDFLETLTVKGTVLPKQVEIIAPKIGGTIEEILVAEGDDVQRGGDPLFRLYSAEAVAEKKCLRNGVGRSPGETGPARDRSRIGAGRGTGKTFKPGKSWPRPKKT